MCMVGQGRVRLGIYHYLFNSDTSGVYTAAVSVGHCSGMGRSL